MTETPWPAEPEIFTIWHFPEKKNIADSCLTVLQNHKECGSWNHCEKGHC